MNASDVSTSDSPQPSARENGPIRVGDFEAAIEASGFGLFNVLLLGVSVFATMSTVFETSTVSYILASAECDLGLTLLDKGILNAVTYAGMILSAIMWGYIADTRGRKQILIFGYMLDALCVVGGAISQNKAQLMVFKFLGGFVVCGPFAVLMSYLSELHGKKYRARILMGVGMLFTIATIILPLLALLILPQTWHIRLLGLQFHSWQIFLAISALPSLLSGLLLPLFPESPKFLMCSGRPAAAMKCFQRIYAINTGRPAHEYPIARLVDESPARPQLPASSSVPCATSIPIEPNPAAAKLERSTNHKSLSFGEGLRQLRPLFAKPYLRLSLLVYLMNFCILLGQNTVRLWLPQLFATMNEFAAFSGGHSGADTSMCAVLAYSVNKTTLVQDASSGDCEVIITSATYTNNLIVAATQFIGYIVAGLLLNRIGSKRILTIALAIDGTCALLMYWATSSLTTLIPSALFVAMGSISSTSVLSASVSLFPTSLRTMVVSLAMMFGRCGSLLGNILFPMLIEYGCLSPFLMLSAVMYSAIILCVFVPDTSKLALQ